MLEPDALESVGEFDVDAEIIRVELEIVALEQPTLFVDVQHQRHDLAVDVELPMVITRGIGGKIDPCQSVGELLSGFGHSMLRLYAHSGGRPAGPSPLQQFPAKMMDAGSSSPAMVAMRCACELMTSSFYLQSPGKIDNSCHRGVRRLTMRNVSSSGQDDGFHRAVAFLLGDFDLAQRAILVIHALDDEDGYPNIAEFLCDFPLAKSRVEPRPAPAVERIVGVLMPLSQLHTQVGGLISLAHACDRADAKFLHKKVRRQQHQAADPMVLDAACIDGRDRRPIAVAEQDAALQPNGIEHVRQHVARLLMHEGHTPRHRGWGGAAVA